MSESESFTKSDKYTSINPLNGQCALEYIHISMCVSIAQKHARERKLRHGSRDKQNGREGRAVEFQTDTGFFEIPMPR